MEPSSNVVVCRDERVAIDGFVATWCPDSLEITWTIQDDQVDPAMALARLFGNFELVAALPGVAAPGPTVFVYKTRDRSRRAAMRELPPNMWLCAAPGLWISHDGQVLSMSPDDPVLAANLMKD